ncbi:RNA polymerase sigma factor RpoD/SigA [Candidatus Woesearchaeota archaeon]|nr:RNA polymerase sigma factor RpoD/SigA [Candidatus Woesearchaeota archaeon]MBW3016147.1 RNA polymerase sigma factor RpoD/SigA [Candidatus Woesearchaeota archaeon]
MQAFQYLAQLEDHKSYFEKPNIDGYPLLTAEQEKEYAKQILFSKRVIIARLSRLPKYEGCLEERLQESYNSGCYSRAKILIKEREESYEALKEKLGACLETITKINPYIERGERPTQRRKTKRRLLNEFGYTHRFISELVRDLKKTELPEYQKEKERIIKFYEKYEQAFDKMIFSNLRLVVSIARRYQNRGLSLSDLVSEGCTGVMTAIEKFKHTREYRFSTYATTWIKQAILRAIYDHSTLVRVPTHVWEEISRVRKAEKKLMEKGTLNPTLEQIAKITGLETKRIEFIKNMKTKPVLQESQNKEEITSIFNRIQDKTAEDPSNSYSDIKDKITELLETLDERDKKILELRFGIKDGIFWTLERISKIFKITRERVRQIEAKALRRLKYKAKHTNLESTL